ncbi:MATE family efflux transporter [Stappia indica]|uniref:MATE family efflux transporter n=1 Tax=Stappia indica TaxID=538381 RepID=UPI001CD2C6C0|nr:MATE family efflux transporter [Stappia indica]MCA1297940.1 MATE family efflux transporter [Stappia indica]
MDTLTPARDRHVVRPFDVSSRTVLAIAVPMTLAYLSTPLLGLVDTVVIGQLGDAALLGGIALGGILFDLVFTTFNFLRSGTTGLTAQAVGAGDLKEERAVLYRACLVALGIGVLVVLLRGPVLGSGLWVMGGSEAVKQATTAYFLVRVLSAPFALLNYAFLGWFIGRGQAGTALVLQSGLNGLNIALSLWFVLQLEWGVAGVAAATVVSELVAALAGTALAARALRGGPLPSRVRIFNKRRFLRMVALNRDIMIRSFALLFAVGFFISRSAVQGDTILAANALLEKFLLIGGYFLDGIATAAEQLAGKAVGARYRPAFDRSVRLCLIWGFALALLAALVFYAGGGWLLHLMTTAPEVRTAAMDYLPWAAAAPLLGALAYQMDGVFIGATWSRDMRNMMLASIIVYLAAYAALAPLLGNHGLWLAFDLFLAARGVTMALICRRRADATFGPAPRSAVTGK